MPTWHLEQNRIILSAGFALKFIRKLFSIGFQENMVPRPRSSHSSAPHPLRSKQAHDSRGSGMSGSATHSKELCWGDQDQRVRSTRSQPRSSRRFKPWRAISEVPGLLLGPQSRGQCPRTCVRWKPSANHWSSRSPHDDASSWLTRCTHFHWIL